MVFDSVVIEPSVIDAWSWSLNIFAIKKNPALAGDDEGWIKRVIDLSFHGFSPRWY